MDPTLAGFWLFIQNIMQISSVVLPTNSTVVPMVYNLAVNTVNVALQNMPNYDATQPTIYALAVYNLAGDQLIRYAPDQTGQTYFASARQTFGVNNFTPGIINSTGDNGSNVGLMIPESLNNLTISDLMNLKTPWGQQYLALAQAYGTLWGIS